MLVKLLDKMGNFCVSQNDNYEQFNISEYILHPENINKFINLFNFEKREDDYIEKSQIVNCEKIFSVQYWLNENIKRIYKLTKNTFNADCEIWIKYRKDGSPEEYTVRSLYGDTWHDNEIKTFYENSYVSLHLIRDGNSRIISEYDRDGKITKQRHQNLIEKWEYGYHYSHTWIGYTIYFDNSGKIISQVDDNTKQFGTRIK